MTTIFESSLTSYSQSETPPVPQSWVAIFDPQAPQLSEICPQAVALTVADLDLFGPPDTFN